MIEAVTGSGKTDVALTAIADAVERGLFGLVIVPSRVLMEQWSERLRNWIPEAEIGRLGDGYRDRPHDCDVLVTTRHSAASRVPLPPSERGGILVADECHGFGGAVLRKSLLPEYQEWFICLDTSHLLKQDHFGVWGQIVFSKRHNQGRIFFYDLPEIRIEVEPGKAE